MAKALNFAQRSGAVAMTDDSAYWIQGGLQRQIDDLKAKIDNSWTIHVSRKMGDDAHALGIDMAAIVNSALSKAIEDRKAIIVRCPTCHQPWTRHDRT